MSQFRIGMDEKLVFKTKKRKEGGKKPKNLMGELLTENNYFLMLIYAEWYSMNLKNCNQTKKPAKLWSH